MKNNMLLTLVTSLLAFNLVAQNLSNDITVKYSQAVDRSNESRIGLEYRRALGENFKVKFGSDFGKSNKDIWTGNNILFGSDSVSITRDLASFSTTYSFYAGTDYEGLDYLSLGASFILGSNQTLLGAFDRGSRYNAEEDSWEHCLECVYEYHGDELPNGVNSSRNWQHANAIKNTNYLMYGISLRAAIRIPIKNRFELTTGYEPSFIKHKVQNETEYQVYEETYSFKQSEFKATSHTVTAALRYRF